MSASALVLILLSGLGWSALDWARKALTEDIRPIPMVALLFAGQAVLLMLLLPWAGWPAIGAGYWAPGLGAIAINLVTNVLFVQALALSPLTLTVPYLSLTPVFTTIMGVAMLGEVPDALDLAGIALVVAGALSLQAPQGNGAIGDLVAGLRREPGTWRMLLISLLWSVAYPLDKLAIAATSPLFHSWAMSAGVALGLFALVLARGRQRELAPARRRWKVVAIGILGATAGLTLQFVAMQAAFVNLVEAIKRVVILTMAAVIGRLAFHEPLGARKLTAIAMMGVGVLVLLAT